MRSDVMHRRGKILPVILAAALLLPASASAQKFWGFTGGATLSDLSDAYGAYSSDSRWGGTAGLVFGVRTYRSTTIRLEPAWISRGGGDLNRLHRSARSSLARPSAATTARCATGSTPGSLPRSR